MAKGTIIKTNKAMHIFLRYKELGNVQTFVVGIGWFRLNVFSQSEQIKFVQIHWIISINSQEK